MMPYKYYISADGAIPPKKVGRFRKNLNLNGKKIQIAGYE